MLTTNILIKSDLHPAQSNRHARYLLLCVFMLTLNVRLMHIAQISSAPFYPMVMGDSLSYSEWAQQIAAGDWIGSEVFYQSPLYPYILAVIKSIAPDSRTSIMFMQALQGSVAATLLAATANRLFGIKTALCAGLIAMCYAPAIFFDGLIQKSSLDFLLISLSIFLLSRWRESRRISLAIQSGISLGLLILNRENFVVTIPAIVAIMGIDIFSDRRQSPPGTGIDRHLNFAKHASMLIGGIALILFPVAFRNLIVGDEFHLTTSQFGPNFFIGNNPDANGMYQPIQYGGGNAASERNDATELAEEALGYKPSPAQVSLFWTRKAWHFIRQQPSSWVQLMFRKLLLLLNAVEVADTEDLTTYAEWSGPLRITSSVLHFGLLAPLAVLGLTATETPRRRQLLVWLLFITYAAGTLMFYVMGRYRFPMAVILILPAAEGLKCLISNTTALIRSRGNQEINTRNLMIASTCAAVTALLCNWPILDVEQMSSVTKYNMAVEFHRLKDYPNAETYYRKSISQNPKDADAFHNLADVMQATGRSQQAIEHFEFALAIQNDRPATHFQLANLYVQQGLPELAIEHYEQLTQLVPDFPAAWLNLSLALTDCQKHKEALLAVQHVVTFAPNYTQAQLALASSLANNGRFEESFLLYQQLLQQYPNNPELLRQFQELKERLEQDSENGKTRAN